MTQLVEFIAHHWPLVGGLVVVLILIWINEMLTAKQQAQSISPQSLVNLMNHDEVKIFDLRQKEVFNKGHIIDAVKVNAEEFNQPHLEKLKNTHTILVCDNGLQSAPLGSKLKKQGFNQVKVLQGGIKAWTDAGLPLVKD
ncbi:rhodanese-like domain-containing protein [Legionella sp. W05-934-2]|jgi:rhodanese-related sulfurtransferase|uniref:rhodanese-like domain-containing protein n=1 Tax=Legionella sp. W05-934-2 TaxID=1198649 RepID=UPI003462BCAE